MPELLSRKIRLFVTPNDPNNAIALKELRRLPNITISELECPPSAKEFYLMPFIEIKPGGKFFGIESIRDFVEDKLLKTS